MPLLDDPELDICDFANDIQDEFNVERLIDARQKSASVVLALHIKAVLYFR
jgi:hypothetical protein